MVWPLPRSLATTYGISFDFSSWGYLDVSVHPVSLPYAMYSHTGNQAFTLIGFPHSDICGSSDICSLPQLIAAYRVLRRLSVPRHSPCALSNLTFFWFSFFVDNPDTLMKFLSKDLLPLAYPLCTLIFARPSLNFLLLFVFSIFGLFLLSLCSFQGALCPLMSTCRLTSYKVSVVGSRGLEPPTLRLSGVRSNHLSYEPVLVIPGTGPED